MTMMPILLAAALSAGNAEFDRTAVEGAQKVALGRAEARIAQEGPEAGKLRQVMLENPKDFATVAQAKDAGRLLYRLLMDGELAAEKKKIDERLGLAQIPQTVSLSEDLAEQAMSRFETYFAAERKAACAEQAKAIVSATRPTEAEFESKSEDQLRKEMTDRIAGEQRIPVFEENRSYISEKIVDPVLASAKAERQRQREYMMRARSDAVAPSRLADDLKARLQANLSERAKSEEASKVWNVFPSVFTKALPEAVERRTLDRLVGAVESVKLDVSADEVMARIKEDPAAHVKAAESERRFAVAYSSRILATALEKTIAEAPAAEREDLKGFLSQRLSSDPATKAVDRLIRRDVMPKWREARAEVAKRFTAETWPSLCEGTWFPSAELADSTAARSDYAEAVKGWRSVTELEALAAAPHGRPVPEESDLAADTAVAAAFDRARNAIAAQNAIVDGSHEAVLAESRRRKDGFWTRTPDLKKVTELLTAATEERWAETRLRTLWPSGGEPANAAEQHRELFPSVRRKIELLAKVILEEMNAPRPEAEPTPEEKPEEPEPEEPTPEEEPVVMYSISVSKTDGKIEVKLLQGKSPVMERTVDERFAPFDEAMKDVARKLGADILNLR